MTNAQRPELSMAEKKELFLWCFAKESGHIGRACHLVGVHRQTFYDWINADPDFAQIVSDINGMDTDDIIAKLKEMAKGGDKVMIKYYLEHKGRKGGFGRRPQQSQLPAPNHSLHLHYHAPPEPKSLADWETQVREAREERFRIENKGNVPVPGTGTIEE